jgi:hypothetical protein
MNPENILIKKNSIGISIGIIIPITIATVFN